MKEVKVFWTDTAVQHLSAIYTYIAQNSPGYAQRLIDRLTRRSNKLPSFPYQVELCQSLKLSKFVK